SRRGAAPGGGGGVGRGRRTDLGAASRPAGLSGKSAGREPETDHDALRRVRGRRPGAGRPLRPNGSVGLRPDQTDQGGLAGVCRPPPGPRDEIMTTPSDLDLLQAYLDGTLSPDEVRAVEARLKTEPALAKALVALAREEAVLTEWARSQRAMPMVPPRRSRPF